MLTSNSASMKKFVIKIFLFAVLVAAIDMSFGFAMDYMHNHVKGGGMAKRLYVARDAKEDIMLFGSSRMCHHYNPMIIEDSLGVTCFNAGEDGNGIIMSYGFLSMMLDRYSPKLIVYDISGFDFAVDDNMKYLSFLRPYYKEPAIKEIITTIEPMERFKMMSSLYRYNSLTIRIAGCYLSSSSEYQKGYLPLSETMDYDVDVPADEQSIIDSVKIMYLQKFINLCREKDIPLVFALSPRYKANDSSFYSEIKILAGKGGIPLLDNYADTAFCQTKKFFKDQTHMNSLGADEYTRYMIPHLREYICNDKE